MLILTYIFFPFDLIPDFLSLIGVMDDVMVAGFVLNWMVKIAPRQLKEKYGFIEEPL
ncbi:YkvA family protein [Peribacillus sp. SCS-155]|uniref:YkvA family protein n=1 Tax=Peribacillus sedimenti TaxID=3115297 RepID=UPI003905D216